MRNAVENLKNKKNKKKNVKKNLIKRMELKKRGDPSLHHLKMIRRVEMYRMADCSALL